MYNIICGDVELEGTIRTFSNELRDAFETELTEIVSNTAAAYGCTAELIVKHMHPAIINSSEELNRIARDAATKLYGEEGIRSMESLMSGEDFSLYMEKVPGFFGFVGAHNESMGIVHSNHHEAFTVDEDSLERGSAFTAQFAVDYLFA